MLSRLNQRQHWIGKNAKKQKEQKQRAHTPTPAVNAETTLAEHTPSTTGTDQQSFRVEYASRKTESGQSGQICPVTSGRIENAS